MSAAAKASPPVAAGALGEQREALVSASVELSRRGVLSPSGHGNVSVRIDHARMLLTASGLSGAVGGSEPAAVGFDGTVETGRLTAASEEIVPMHAVVYKNRPDTGAVVHTHSSHLTVFALAHRPLPCRYEALLRCGQRVEVPVVLWAPRGSEASVAGIAEALGRNPGTLAVLLANHGILVFGASAKAATNVLVALEEAAAAELRATAIGGAKDLPPGAFDEVRSSMGRAAERHA